MEATHTAPDAASGPYTPTHKIRFVTAASIIRRTLLGGLGRMSGSSHILAQLARGSAIVPRGPNKQMLSANSG